MLDERGDMALPGRIRTVGWLICLVLVAASRVWAGESLAEEYQVKAAFLFNFAKFVEWPPDAFKSPADPFLICVLGENPFGGALEDVVRNKTWGNRALAVREVSNSQQAAACQIVFIGSLERKRARPFLNELKGRSILTVGENDDFIANGGIVNFKLKDARVRIEIDAACAERARLRISSKLLSLAEIIRN